MFHFCPLIGFLINKTGGIFPFFLSLISRRSLHPSHSSFIVQINSQVPKKKFSHLSVSFQVFVRSFFQVSLSVRFQVKSLCVHLVKCSWSISGMSGLNFFKPFQILSDHDRCIEWCKEHNRLTSSVKCPRAECSNSLSWT